MGVCGSNTKHTKSSIPKATLRMESGLGAAAPVAVYKSQSADKEVPIDIRTSHLGKFAITSEIEQNAKAHKSYEANKDRFYHGVSNSLGISTKATIQDVKTLFERSPQALKTLILETEIPAVLKWDVWQLLVSDHRQRELDDRRFDVLVKAKNEKVNDIVNKDVPRTFNEKQFFVGHVQDVKVGKEMLYKICKAVGTYFKHIGYTQGFNFLAAYCLEVSGARELDSLNFILKFLTHERYMFVGVYEDMFPLVYFINFLFHSKLAKIDPQVAMFIKDSGLPDEVWLHKWVMSIFVGYFPNYFCSRVLDLILATDIFSLASFMVSFVLSPVNRKEFVKNKDDFSGLAEHLSGLHHVESVDWNGMTDALVQTTIQKHMCSPREVLDAIDEFAKSGHPCLKRFERYGAVFRQYLDRNVVRDEVNITVYSFDGMGSVRGSDRSLQVTPGDANAPLRNVQVQPPRPFTNDLEELERINHKVRDVEEGVQGNGRMEQKYVDGVQVHENVFFRKKPAPATVQGTT